MRQFLAKPTYQLLTIWLLCLAASAGAIWFATHQPSLGMNFKVSEGQVRVAKVTAAQGAAVAPGARLLRINGMDIRAGDLDNDADMTLNFDGLTAYYARLNTLDAMLHGQTVTLAWADDQDAVHETVIQPQPRLLGSLSAAFWVVLLVGDLCLFISAWVYVLKPRDWGARMFVLSGLMLMVSAYPTAIMYSRELALSGNLFRAMLLTNHFGATMYGATIAPMFLLYPKILVSPRHLLWLPVMAAATFIAELAEVGDEQNSIVFMAAAMLISVIAAVVQWRLTREQPLERASLRWFLLATMVGLMLLTVTLILPPLFGLLPLISTGYAFVFFLIMYVGIALGLRKFRLFDLDEWAYRILLWMAGATAVIAMDIVLVAVGLEQTISLSLTLLLCGGLYFPFRQWLWQRIVNRQTPSFESLLPELSAIAFAATPVSQRERWEALLRRLHDPLELKTSDAQSGAILDEGLRMQVPGCGTLPAYTLHYAGHGARLFSSRDAIFAASLSQLLEQIMSGRSSYEQGVAQERLRIGRDLHDNIGARLLKLIHHLRGTPNAEVARDAMKDLRTAIASMDTRPVPLRNALADWRAEADARCEVAGCRLHWQQNEELPAVELAPRMKATLESVVREIITNALKHASPKRIDVEISADAHVLRASVCNDGEITDPLTWKDGYGLRSMRGRLEELSGCLHIAPAQDKVQLIAEVPLL